MKKRKMLVRAVALFMVGLITALALVIPSSAIVSQYVDEDNNPSPDCPIPFDVRFWYEQSGADETLYFGYDVPIGYGSLEQNFVSGGLDSAEGKKYNSTSLGLDDESFRAYYSVGAPVYLNYMTAWGEIIDYWGYVPVELNAQAVDRTNFDGIAIDAPTFFYNVWESTFYQDTDEGMKLFSMPTIQLPVLDDGQVYVGRYTVTCGIYDTNGEFRNVEYSIPIDQRIDNDPIPFLYSSIFEQYLTKTEDDLVNNYIVAIDGFQAYIDVDVYELVPSLSNVIIRINGSDRYFPIPSGATLWADMNNVYSDNGSWVIQSNSGYMTVYCDDDLSPSEGTIYYNDDGPEVSPLDNISTNPIYNAYPTHGGGSNDLGDNYMSSTLSNDDAIPVTLAIDDEWQIVEDSPDKCTRLLVTYPIHKIVAPTIGGGTTNDVYNRYGYPDWHKYDNSRSHKISTDVEVDFTGWIATATSGFLNFELLPNFSIGGVLAILVGFSLVILFLKIFAGG